MKATFLFGAAILAAMFAPGARAEGPSGWQVSAQAGQERLRIDDDRLVTGETIRMDMGWMGVGLAYRAPQGLLVEGGYSYAVHDDWVDFNEDSSIELYHYSFALGWQFENDGWRFTPKVGAIRSKLNSEARLLLNDDGGTTDKFYSTVPFVEAQVSKRLGKRWTIGLTVRDVQEEFGHSRAWGAVASFTF